ncbi:hypothetical protein [Thalassoroseus pseudoceratinae]|uniref:hypothetical protein n=1 Tax=Thalassoroseus pseudoceratinae TaxID=2713176 RepID=UPI001420913C|nr:hypothetical protein [Thalassoroseus pseudoceratinae]
MSLSGQYSVGPIDFQRGEFLPGPIDPAAVRMALILADGVLAADYAEDDVFRQGFLESLEHRHSVLGFLRREPVLLNASRVMTLSIPDYDLTYFERFLRFLREAENVEIVTQSSDEVVTSRILDWLAERSRLETLLKR